MAESNVAKLIEMKTVKTKIVKGEKVSIETNSKGDKVTWLRLGEEIKDNNAFTVTSKNNTEYAAKLNIQDPIAGFAWLQENAGLENVKEFWNGLFTVANRPIIATAGASGIEADCICDIESLVAYETLQSARGRKASKFDSDMWKTYSPILADSLRVFFEEKKVTNVAPLVNKYLHLIKGVIVHFSPIGDNSTMNKAASMIEFTFSRIVETRPDLETLGAFAVTVMESNRDKYSTESDPEY